MKRTLGVFMLFLLLVSCSKKGATAPAGEVAITERGEGYGPVTEKMIGPEGGVIISNDKRFEVKIPAGALTANTTFNLQAISNTSPAGIGFNYRLSPAIKFARPVTITLQYEEETTEDSAAIDPCMVSLGYQDSSGAWKMKTNRTVNTGNRTISTEASQGGDWCALTPIRLVPEESFIKKNEQVKLQVLWYIAMGEEGVCGLWNRSGDHHAEQAVTFGTPVDQNLIRKWELLAAGYGVGTLTPHGAIAIYKASAFDNPIMNPANIAVTLQGSSRPLWAKVFVEPEETYMIITMANKTYIYTAVEAKLDQSANNYAIRWEERPSRKERGVFTWSGKSTGNHTWDKNDNQFFFFPEDFPNDAFLHSFVGEPGIDPCDGYIKIDEFGAMGHFATGTFLVVDAAHRDPDRGFQGSMTIRGRFKARRVE